MKKLLLTFFIFYFSFSAFSYPITPRPLRKLVIESDYIVQAFVLGFGCDTIKKTKKKKGYSDTWNKTYALLLIREVWKGQITSDTVKVYYVPGMICPAPARFEEHTEVIAFLDDLDNKEGVKNGFSVHALSYGAKTFFDNVGIAVYKKRIEEMQVIIPQNESPEKQNKIIEWLVCCAENQYTRWEGVYELSPQSDFMSYYDQEQDNPKEIYLSQTQRNRLFNALMQITEPGYYDIGLANLCKGINDDKLLDFYKKMLEKLDKESLWYADAYMERIAGLTGDNELTTLFNSFKNLSSYNEEGKKLQKEIFEKFVERMKQVRLKDPLIASGESSA